MNSPSVSLRRSFRVLCTGILIASLSACGGGSSNSTPAPTPSPVLLTSFVSADAGPNLAQDEVALALQSAGSAQIIEGDLYRVLENGKTLASLNFARGLQIVDISNPDQPKLVSRLELSGSPIEMYVQGQRAYILLGNVQRMQKAASGNLSEVQSIGNSEVVSVDLSDVRAPRILSRSQIEGYVQGSLLQNKNGQLRLFTNSSVWSNGLGSHSSLLPTKALMHSFVINAQGVAEKQETLSLQGEIQTLYASGDYLITARNMADGKSRLNLINTAANFALSEDVVLAGMVRDRANLQVQGNILRAFSASGQLLGGKVENYLQTFNLSQLPRVTEVAKVSFGSGENLFGTKILSDRAFAVTYLRQDPFHAFSIQADGSLKEESSFIVSGWNDFLQPVFNERRLLGVGQNDLNNKSQLSISLYDTTNLQSAQPLLARADSDLDANLHSAIWDKRGYSVLENVTDLPSADGKARETGLLLLPYYGYTPQSQRRIQGVQIFSFSDKTVSIRGKMQQEDDVLRSFSPQNNLAANISHTKLSLFDLQNPNQPSSKGWLQISANYSQFVALSNVGVRYRGAETVTRLPDQKTDILEIVNLQNVDAGQVLASIPVLGSSRIFALNDKLLAVSPQFVNGRWEVEIQAWDLTTPSQPLLLGNLKAGLLPPKADPLCPSPLDCGLGFNMDIKLVGQSLVLIGKEWENNKQHFVLYVADVRNPKAMKLEQMISTFPSEKAVGTLVQDNSIWLNFKRKEASDAQARMQARYYLLEVNLQNPAQPVLKDEINVPGEVLQIRGNEIFSRDFVWGQNNQIQYVLQWSTLQGKQAQLQSGLNLGSRNFHGLQVDGNQLAFSQEGGAGKMNEYDLVHLQKQGTSLQELQRQNLKYWHRLLALQQGKTVLNVSGGVMLADLNGGQAKAQAFIPVTNGYLFDLVQDSKGNFYFPANWAGVRQFTWQSNSWD